MIGVMKDGDEKQDTCNTHWAYSGNQIDLKHENTSKKGVALQPGKEWPHNLIKEGVTIVCEVCVEENRFLIYDLDR